MGDAAGEVRRGQGLEPLHAARCPPSRNAADKPRDAPPARPRTLSPRTPVPDRTCNARARAKRIHEDEDARGWVETECTVAAGVRRVGA
eukprot:3906128-Rhodomonas_salina.2